MVNIIQIIKKWTNDEIDNLYEKFSISVLFTEVNKDGRVIREIGLDENNNIIHKCPSKNYKYGKYGLFDLVKVDLSNDENNFDNSYFEELWEKD